MDEGDGECQGQVVVSGDNDVTPCAVCGYGATDAEYDHCIGIADRINRDYDANDTCEEDYDQ